MAVSIGTRTLNWTCGLFATVLAIAVLPLVAWNVYWAVLSCLVGSWVLAGYYVLVALLFLGVPVVFLRAYDRWQTEKGLQ